MPTTQTQRAPRLNRRAHLSFTAAPRPPAPATVYPDLGSELAWRFDTLFSLDSLGDAITTVVVPRPSRLENPGWARRSVTPMVSSAVSMANTDVAGNINQAYQNQLDAWNARQQSSNSFLNSLMGVGGQLGAAFISDRRLKTNVKRVGLLPQGIGVYDYEYAGDPKHERIRGVMAQEVERVDPDAVLEMDDGYKAVDYSRVLAKALEAA